VNNNSDSLQCENVCSLISFASLGLHLHQCEPIYISNIWTSPMKYEKHLGKKYACTGWHKIMSVDLNEAQMSCVTNAFVCAK
jgi:hypothetical protein